MGSEGLCLKKCPKSCWPIRNKGKNTKNTPLTSLSPASFPLLLLMKNRESPLKLKKTSRVSYLGRYQPIHVNKVISIWWPSHFKMTTGRMLTDAGLITVSCTVSVPPCYGGKSGFEFESNISQSQKKGNISKAVDVFPPSWSLTKEEHGNENPGQKRVRYT